MIVKEKKEFQKIIDSYKIDTDSVIVKPNWVSNTYGEYTEPELLDWLFEVLPQKKTVIESYTPWRGSRYLKKNKNNIDVVSLEKGKDFWEFYKKQDKQFLKSTGIGKILDKYNVQYINITNEYWKHNCVNPHTVKKYLKIEVKHNEFFSYIPKQLFELKDTATLISLAKIKEEPSIPVIGVSMSVKNLFGLIPHPARWIPYHKNNHKFIPIAIKDIFNIYNNLFKNSLWINEAIKTNVKNYCEEDQTIEKNNGWLFAGQNAVFVDSKTCKAIGIDPNKIPHLELIKQS